MSRLLAHRWFIWGYSIAWGLGLYLVYFRWSLPVWLQWTLSVVFILFVPPLRVLRGRSATERAG
jgi:hypothetical protein